MNVLKFDIKLLKEVLGTNCTFLGDNNVVCDRFNSLDSAEKNDIVWIKPNLLNSSLLINSTKASCIICDQETFEEYKGSLLGRLFVINANPKSIYFSLLQYIKKCDRINEKSSIHATAYIDSRCVLGENVSIGAYSIIGNCVIGDNAIIGDNVKIFDNVVIGSDCLIRENVSIGGDGFGFYVNEKGEINHIPHIGNVKIGNNVQIFPFVNIDRGTLGSTVIDDGSVIDHYVHVSHNSKVGKNTIICANSVLAGGSEVKENCFLGVNTLLKEKVKIGNNSKTGMGSVVVKEIPDHEIWVGNPAKFLKKNLE